MSENATHVSLEKCLSYIDCHLQSPTAKQRGRHKTLPPPSVTISRQTGAGGTSVGSRLASYLKLNAVEKRCPWTVFDKNLVSRVLQEHHLPERLAQFMPEDKVSGIADAVEELLGLHPAAWKLVHKSTETILNLAQLGGAVFVGRGAAVILGHLPQVLHVRLVGSPESRIGRVKEHYRVDAKAAREFIRKEDAARKRYVKQYLKRDIDDPLLYHLTLNTDLISADDAAEIIGEIVLQRFS